MHNLKMASTWSNILTRAASGSGSYTFLDKSLNTVDKISYEEVNSLVGKLAARLASVTKEAEPILLLLDHDRQFIIAFNACLVSGRVAVPTFPHAENRNLFRLNSVLNSLRPRTILTNKKVWDRIVGKIQAVENLLFFEDQESWGEARLREVPGNALAMIQYTSGSTSEPKGVCISHKNILHNMAMIKQEMYMSRESKVFSWLPFYHDMGLIGCVLQPMYAACDAFYISPVSFLTRPRVWLDAISKFKVTVTGGPNFSYEVLLRKVSNIDSSEIDLSSLKVLFNGSEPIFSSTCTKIGTELKRFKLDPKSIFNCYGLAEATLYVSGGFFLEGGAYGSFASSGTISNGNVVKILCDEKELGFGEIGEVAISGDNISQGYFNLDNQDNFLSLDRVKYFKTGDLGFLNDNELFITGRKKDLIIINGVNIYPADIETAILESCDFSRPGGVAATSVFRENENKEELILFFEADLKKLEETSIKSFINAVIFKYIGMTPGEIVFLRPGTIPKTTSGKIQRSMLRQMFLSDQLTIEGGLS